MSESGRTGESWIYILYNCGMVDGSKWSKWSNMQRSDTAMKSKNTQSKNAQSENS